MKKRMMIVLIGISAALLFACGEKTNETKQNSQPEQKQTIPELSEEESQKELVFEDANILDFNLASRDDDSFEEIISTFTVTNKGQSAIDQYTANFIYLDANGNQICEDGRYNDCQLESGKTSTMKSFSNLNGKVKTDIANIELLSYSYTIGDTSYEINSKLQTVNSWKDIDKTNVDFDNVNVLEFIGQSKGNSDSDSYEVEVQIKNNGQIPINFVYYKMGYYDKLDNFLFSDSRDCDTIINSGNFALSNSLCDDKLVLHNVATFEVFKYEYDLVEVDHNGFNHYEINVRTKSAIGSIK